MRCNCGKQMDIGTFLTKLGNEIEYEECEDCGVIEVSK